MHDLSTTTTELPLLRALGLPQFWMSWRSTDRFGVGPEAALVLTVGERRSIVVNLACVCPCRRTSSPPYVFALGRLLWEDATRSILKAVAAAEWSGTRGDRSADPERTIDRRKAEERGRPQAGGPLANVKDEACASTAWLGLTRPAGLGGSACQSPKPKATQHWLIEAKTRSGSQDG